MFASGPIVCFKAKMDADGDSVQGRRFRVAPRIEPEVLWSCMTCGECVEQCPVDIEHVDAIIDMRRFEVLMGVRAFRARPEICSATWRTRETPGGSASSKTHTNGQRVLSSRCPIVSGPRPETTSSTCTGSAAPARWTNAAVKSDQSTARLLQPRRRYFAILGPHASHCTGDPGT